jgi:hypothetical protein
MTLMYSTAIRNVSDPHPKGRQRQIVGRPSKLYGICYQLLFTYNSYLIPY